MEGASETNKPRCWKHKSARHKRSFILLIFLPFVTQLALGQQQQLVQVAADASSAENAVSLKANCGFQPKAAAANESSPPEVRQNQSQAALSSSSSLLVPSGANNARQDNNDAALDAARFNASGGGGSHAHPLDCPTFEVGVAAAVAKSESLGAPQIQAANDALDYAESSNQQQQQQQQLLRYSAARHALRVLLVCLVGLVLVALVALYAIKFCVCRRKRGEQFCELESNAQNETSQARRSSRNLIPFGGETITQQRQLMIDSVLRNHANQLILTECSCSNPPQSGAQNSARRLANNSNNTNNRAQTESGRRRNACARLWAAFGWRRPNALRSGVAQQSATPPPSVAALYQQLAIVERLQELAMRAPPPQPPQNWPPNSCVCLQRQPSCLNGAPPAYSDIFGAAPLRQQQQEQQCCSSNSAGWPNQNPEARSSVPLDGLASAASAASAQPTDAASESASAQLQEGQLAGEARNLLVKVNLNKTKLLSAADLMLLSKLIDVPIVVQQPAQAELLQLDANAPATTTSAAGLSGATRQASGDDALQATSEEAHVKELDVNAITELSESFTLDDEASSIGLARQSGSSRQNSDSSQ